MAGLPANWRRRFFVVAVAIAGISVAFLSGWIARRGPERSATVNEPEQRDDHVLALGRAIVRKGSGHGDLHREGGSDSSAEIKAIMNEDISLFGINVACARCHGPEFDGRTEGATKAPAITRGQYADARLLLRAVNQGITPDGRQLSREMPRFQLSESQGGAVLRYIDLIRETPDIGVTSIEILIAVTGPDAAIAGNVAALMNELNAGTEINGRRVRFAALFGTLPKISEQAFAVVVTGSAPSEIPEDVPVFQSQAQDAQKSPGGVQLFSLVRPASVWVQKLSSALKTGITPCRSRERVQSVDPLELGFCQTRTGAAGRGEFYSRWPLAVPGIGQQGFAARDKFTPEAVFAKLIVAGLSRVASPPRRAAFVNALRSGESFDVGGGVVLRFRQDHSIGLDGFYIYREGGRGLERLWRPF